MKPANKPKKSRKVAKSIMDAAPPPSILPRLLPIDPIVPASPASAPLVRDTHPNRQDLGNIRVFQIDV